MDYEATIIGSGVVGLAIARELSISGLKVLVLEKEHRSGEEISSRNSGVIHAGMYYPSNSLKARLCVEGNRYLYKYIKEKGISYKKVGKLIVSNSQEDENKLQKIYEQGIRNCVKLEIITPEAAKKIEPNISCKLAISSPNTGIIDVPEFISALEGDVQHNGGYVSMNSEFLSAEEISGGFSIRIKSGDELNIKTKYLINSSGLHSYKNSKLIKNLNDKYIHQIYYGKGHYFKYSGNNPFNGLIYPIPSPGGLGIHVGMDITNQLRFGPDFEWSDDINYSFDESLKNKFVTAIKEYWPELDEDRLIPDYTGIRPKIYFKDMEPKDFSIKSHVDHGMNGLINLQGIESPGLTSSMAIGKYIKELLEV